MRFRSTIILALLLAGLGAYVYWVELPKAEQEAKKKTLFEFKADDVTGVTLAYADREIALEKLGEDWRLTKPVDAAADAVTVKNLINAIAECEVKKTLDDAKDLAQYGLDQPFVKVTVTLKDKELPTILVGKNTPVGFSTYIQKADDPKVLLTSSAFRSGMDKQPKDVRDKTILTFSDTDVQKIELHGDGKDIVLAHTDDTWKLEQPGPYAADAARVHTFLSTLRSMRAVDFPADQPTDLHQYGLDTPRLKVAVVVGKDNAQKQVLLGSENDKKEVYVQTNAQPTVYTVSDWVFRDLNKDPAEFRDKTVLAFDRDKIIAVDVTRSDGSTTKLVRGDDKQWRVDGAGDAKSSATAISQYISDLHDLKGYELLADQPTDLAPFGLDHPALKLAVIGEDHKPAGTVWLGSRQNGEGKKEYTAMAEGGPTVFLVRDYSFTRLDKQPQDFLEKPTPTPGPKGAAPPQLGGGGDADDEPMSDEPMGDAEPGGEQD